MSQAEASLADTRLHLQHQTETLNLAKANLAAITAKITSLSADGIPEALASARVLATEKRSGLSGLQTLQTTGQVAAALLEGATSLVKPWLTCRSRANGLRRLS
ncbi:hypothetical protein CONLIGDRAFT_643004 [Coniochaeta ligniaria NRRL 30616]|uniref:Uncharacterized protein n=1 Tax=Coniochaeta ligniaria NRRL 30616 TaxID=1408157 RepID=A0A1J7JM70_9PEZI|nr:hypothetical protein CONLIGDRAFT_643004 [Coniochaeta ligniaria NRRL 30616]